MVLATFKTARLVVAEPLTPELFAPFGGVISSPHQLSTVQSASANYGTAVKLFKVSPVVNNYAGNAPSGRLATANWNLFRCSPPNHLINDGKYLSKVLERHPFSTQTFLPMGRAAEEIAYMVIVAPSREGDSLPDVDKARAFTCLGNQAVTYGAGTWHAPMVSLGDTTDFAVLIHENGVADEDCQEVYLDTLEVEFTLDRQVDIPARKPQSEESYQNELAQFRERGPERPGQTSNDPHIAKIQIKFEAERLYYQRKYDDTVSFIDERLGNVDDKMAKELAEIKQHALEQLSK